MKLFFVPMLLLLFFGSALGQSSALDDVGNIEKLEWLIGTWNRTNAKPGRSGAEVWKKNSDTELHGRGISMKGNDTSFVEKLKIVVKENKLYYVADVPDNKAVVYFAFTDISPGGFTCENPDHDFPKKIQYRRDGRTLTAMISGDGKSIVYLFQLRQR